MIKKDLNDIIKNYMFNIYAQLPFGEITIDKDIFFYYAFLIITYRGFIRYYLDNKK